MHFKKLIGFIFVFALSIFVPLSLSALEATYYTDSFEGGGTSNGDQFSQATFSAAACSVELGQYGYVSYGNTGMVVTVNDRPSCSRYPNIIDLSKIAFQTLASTSAGRIKDISLSILGKNVNSFPKKIFSGNTFANLGIRLVNPISNTYFTDDSILIRGKVTIKKDTVIVALISKETGEKIITQLVRTDKNSNFSYVFHLPKLEGDYYFIIAGGNSFNVDNSTIPLIKVMKKESLNYPDIPSTLRIFHPIVSGGENPSITLPENLWASMQIVRDGRTFTTQGSALSFDGISFIPGKAEVNFDGYILSTPSSLDRSKYIPSLWSGSVILDRTHENIGREKISIRTTRQAAIFRFRLKPGVRIRSSYYVALPNGDVREYDFPKIYIDTNNLLKTGIWIKGSFGMRDQGTYKLEFVQEDGFAYVNTPLFQGNVWSVLPSITESQKTTLRKQFTSVQGSAESAINRLRAGLARSLVSIDPNLSALAQAKAEDMAQYDYVGHYTKNNSLDILAFAKSINITIVGSIGENVAGGNVSDIALQDGLEESGSHRYNMLDPLWTKVGIGYVLKNGKVYMVEVFGE